MVDNQGLQVMNHMLGGTGYITHLATIWPEYDLGTWDLLEAGDYVAAQARITAANWPWQSFRGKMWKRTGAESPGRESGPGTLRTARRPQPAADPRVDRPKRRPNCENILERIGVPDLVCSRVQSRGLLLQPHAVQVSPGANNHPAVGDCRRADDRLAHVVLGQRISSLSELFNTTM